jgi:hypothetical protein
MLPAEERRRKKDDEIFLGTTWIFLKMAALWPSVIINAFVTECILPYQQGT